MVRTQRRYDRVEALVAEGQGLSGADPDSHAFVQGRLGGAAFGVTDHVRGRIDADQVDIRTTPADLDQ